MESQTLDIQIKIPDDYIIVKKVDWERMQDRPKWARGMDWLIRKTGKSRDALLDDLLIPFRGELEASGIVDYEDRWRFNISLMDKWLEENSYKVFNRR